MPLILPKFPDSSLTAAWPHLILGFGVDFFLPVPGKQPLTVVTMCKSLCFLPGRCYVSSMFQVEGLISILCWILISKWDILSPILPRKASSSSRHSPLCSLHTQFNLCLSFMVIVLLKLNIGLYHLDVVYIFKKGFPHELVPLSWPGYLNDYFSIYMVFRYVCMIL